MSVRLDFKSENISIFRRFSFLKATAKWVDEVAPEIVDAIKEEAPVRKGPGGGRLRDSITSRRSFGLSGVGVEFGSKVPYAGYVEEGTPPHIIRPRSARALRFTGRSGATVYAAYVNHPGTKPNPFARRAVERVSPEIQRRFKEVIEAQFRKE